MRWRKCPVLMPFLGLAVLYPNPNVTMSEVLNSACWEKQTVPWPRAMRKEVLVAQLCPTFCDPMGCSPPGSSVHGILQERIQECVAIPLSRGYSWLRDWTWISCTAGGFFTNWTTREAIGRFTHGTQTLSLPRLPQASFLRNLYTYPRVLAGFPDKWHKGGLREIKQSMFVL